MKILKLISVFLGASIIFSGFILSNKVDSIQTTENQLVSFPCLTLTGSNITAELDGANRRITIGHDIFQFIKINEDKDKYEETLIFEKSSDTGSTLKLLLNISFVYDISINAEPVLNYACKLVDGV